jgi:hypothetical protein
MRTMETKDLMGLLPESAVIVSQRPPLWHSRRERRSYRALLCRSCLRLDIEGQLHAMCTLFVNFPHMRKRMVGLCRRRRVLCNPT